MRIKLSFPITLDFITRSISPVSSLNKDLTITHISTDTRNLSKGDLFFALKGDRFDGERFINDAIIKGAYTVSSKYSSASFLVNDTKEALMELARNYKSMVSPKYTIAITGSVGKTTTKEITASLLSSKYNVHKTEKNYNNELGVAFTILSLPKNTDILIAECGMNHFGELSKISKMLLPDIAVITKIGTAHIGNLGSREGIAKAKLEILDGMAKPVLFAPYDEILLLKNDPITVSTSNDRSYYSIFFGDAESSSVLSFKEKGKTKLSIISEPIPIYLRDALAYALSISSIVGLCENDIISGYKNIDFSKYNKLTKIGNNLFYDDSYNSSPEALNLALSDLSTYKYKSAILGDMLELGEKSVELHYKIGKELAKHGFSKLYLIGKYGDIIKKGVESECHPINKIFVYKDISLIRECANDVIKNSDNEVILIKASHRMELWRIKEIIKEQLCEF